MVKKEFITTTGNIEGYNIDKYLGIVNDQIIYYNNEQFIQKSSVYEKLIEEMQDELINNIKIKAEKRGANAIIGLKINIGELNLTEDADFFGTASATAVYIRSNMSKTEDSEDTITADKMRNAILAEEYSQKILNPELSFKEKIQIIEQLNDECIIVPLDRLINFIYESDFKNDTSTLDARETQFNAVLNYLENYGDYDIAIGFNTKLQGLDIKDDKKLFYYIYKNAVSVYYEEIFPMLDTLNVNILSKTIFPKLLEYKETYSLKDSEIIDKITDRMKQFLKLDAENANDQEAWVCAFCGQKNSGKNIWCKTCGKGKNGLTEEQEQMIKNIILHLVKINYVLKTNSINKQ
ncbi:MAG: heavy metal-binding domain-containing protein [Eubacteriaceae bacterium]|nr:heavy metal-binding domain-containing protein [Eubacteriaceae bacterium]